MRQSWEVRGEDRPHHSFLGKKLGSGAGISSSGLATLWKAEIATRWRACSGNVKLLLETCCWILASDQLFSDDPDGGTVPAHGPHWPCPPLENSMESKGHCV